MLLTLVCVQNIAVLLLWGVIVVLILESWDCIHNNHLRRWPSLWFINGNVWSLLFWYRWKLRKWWIPL